MNSPVSYTVRQNIGVITIDNPPVNALSHAVRQGLYDTIEAAEADADARAIVLLCAGRTFIAGADITEFGKPLKDPWLPDLLNRIERTSKLVVAGLHGTALGGGFETALAAHYRCAVPSARVGLPEVHLGLLPGAGGTQRAPRLAGVEAALELITSGRPIGAERAHAIGLVDRIVDGELDAATIQYAEELLENDAPVRQTSAQPIAAFSPELFDESRARLTAKARGQIAPLHIVDCVEAATRLPFDEGLAFERERFSICMDSPQSAAMRHAFFAEREAAKVDGLDKSTPRRNIERVAVIGAGTMGGGIAMCFANAGIPVTLLEISDDALQRGLGVIEKNYAGSVSRGKLSEAASAAARALIVGATDYSALSDVDLVIEAVFEDPDLKQRIFRQLDEVCKDGAILATNTSYQDVNAIAAATARPEDVVGMHFFSPANIMKLLEVVRGDTTADDVLATVLALAKRIRKVPVVARVCYGFIGNRMLKPYGNAAQRLLLEGATPEQVDTAMQDWGMAMGPFRVFDLAGLDVGYKARQALPADQRGDPATHRVADRLVESGRLGQKSGAGFYRYDDGRKPRPDPVVAEVIASAAEEFGIERRKFDDSEIVERLIGALVDEGHAILDEGIAQRPGDIDVVWIYGYGFPVARGGPMYYAEHGR